MKTYDTNIAILSFAVISDRYNNNESVILSFEPLVEDLLLTIAEEVVQKTKLIELYEQRYGYPMPPAILNEILLDLRSKNKIDFLKHEYLEIKKNQLQEMIFEYRAKLNELKSNFSLFAKENGVDIKPSEVVEILLDFMLDHAIDLNSFFNFLGEENTISCENGDKHNKIIADFLMKIRLDNPKLFELLNDIYYGVTLSSVLQLDQAEIENLEDNNGISDLILDSNYIFRLLDLQTVYEHEATLHTHKLAQSVGANFFVLPETLEQVSKTLTGFVNDINPHVTTAMSSFGDDMFSGLYSAYFRRGFEKSNISNIISNLQKILEEDFGVKTWNDETAIITEADSEAISSLGKFKPTSEYEGLEHDLILVKTVDMYRPKIVPDMSKAKIWVLTDDNKLMKWSSSKYNKKRVPECLTESQLSTILWLKSPKKISGQALENVVFALRNQSLINKDQYKRISKIIERQKERYAADKAKLSSMGLLFSTNCLSLSELDKLADSDEKVDKFFDERIERAQQVVDEIQRDNEKYKDENEAIKQQLEQEYQKAEDTKSLITKQEREIINNLESSIVDLNELIKEKTNKKQQYENEKNKQRRKIALRLNVLVAVLGIVFPLILIFINKKTSLFDKHGDLISIIISFLSLVFIFIWGIELLDFIKKIKENFIQKSLMKRYEKEKCPNYDLLINQTSAKINELEKKCEERKKQLEEKLESM